MLSCSQVLNATCMDQRICFENYIKFGLAFSWQGGDRGDSWDTATKMEKVAEEEELFEVCWTHSRRKLSAQRRPPSLTLLFLPVFLLLQMHLHVLRYFPWEPDSNSEGKISHQSQWQRGRTGDSLTGRVEDSQERLPWLACTRAARLHCHKVHDWKKERKNQHCCCYVRKLRRGRGGNAGYSSSSGHTAHVGAHTHTVHTLLHVQWHFLPNNCSCLVCASFGLEEEWSSL